MPVAPALKAGVGTGQQPAVPNMCSSLLRSPSFNHLRCGDSEAAERSEALSYNSGVGRSSDLIGLLRIHTLMKSLHVWACRAEGAQSGSRVKQMGPKMNR